MTDLIWIHDEALRQDHPVFAGGGRAVFIWDDDYFDTIHAGFKQRGFIYEALLRLPVEIYKGKTVETLAELAEGASIRAASTPNPYLRAIMADIRKTHQLTLVDEDVFAHLKGAPDLRRFFKYWNKAKTSAMQMHGGTPDLFNQD